MLVSIITPVLNGNATIENTIKSVLGQSHKEIEYIVIDGGSTDGTLDTIRKYSGRISKIVSGKDKGIYDAMNKGIKLACGEIVGIINSDDFYPDNYVLETIVKTINENRVDSCYGDLVYVSKNNNNRIIRRWKSCIYKESLLKNGWIPPHPTFFVKRVIYEKYGVFNSNLSLAADYELILRFLGKHKIKTYYIPKVLVKMRAGGNSSRNLGRLIKQNLEVIKVLKDNGINNLLRFYCIKTVVKLRQLRQID